MASLNLIYLQSFLVSSEFNYPFVSPGRNPVPYTFDKTVKMVKETSRALEILNNTAWMWFGPRGHTCINWTDPSFIGDLVPVIQRKAFAYVTCEPVSIKRPP